MDDRRTPRRKERLMPPVQIALPLALMVGAAIAATTTPSRTDIRELASSIRLSGRDLPHMARLLEQRPALHMLSIAIAPGAPLPWHPGVAPAAGYVTAGELHMRAPTGDIRVVRPGDSLGDAPHALRDGVAGPAGATVMVFYGDGGGADGAT